MTKSNTPYARVLDFETSKEKVDSQPELSEIFTDQEKAFVESLIEEDPLAS